MRSLKYGIIWFLGCVLLAVAFSTYEVQVEQVSDTIEILVGLCWILTIYYFYNRKL